VPVKFVFSNSQMAVWMLLHQTCYSVSKCEDAIYAGTGITTQQHAVLMAIKYADAPATPTQIAEWVDRNTNSITLIVDRMEKNGLVKRERDSRDRRSLRIAITEKGEDQLKKSAMTGWNLIKGMLDGLSEEELQLLAKLLEKVRTRAIQHRQNDKILKEVVVDSQPNMAHFLGQVTHGKK
jgi:MarR family 2-MHQ and catechol resistance regulon transcriptional repressor